MRRVRIDETRGVACLFVVAFHAIASDPATSAGAAGYLSASLVYVRMPLFMVITGYLFGCRAPITIGVGRILRKRLLRLALPFLLLTLVCWLIDHAAHVRSSLANALVFGSWHLWYLQALMLITLVYVPFEAWARPSANALLALTICAALFSATDLAATTIVFSADRAAGIAPFFLFGVWLGRDAMAIDRRAVRLTLYAAAAIGFVVEQLALNGVGAGWSKTSLIASCVGAGTAVFLLRNTPRWTSLATLGRYSFPIYLWHLPWFATTSFVVLHPLGITGPWSVALRVVVGVIAPIVVLESVRRHGVLPVIVIGDGGIRRRGASAVS